MIPRIHHLGVLAWLMAGSVMAVGTRPARADTQPPAQPAPTPQDAAPSPAPAREPTLDELLGITPPPPPQPSVQPGPQSQAPAPPGQPTAPAPADPRQAELRRQLEARPISDQFVRALALMQDAAARIEQSKDVGVETQRVQDEVLRMLDQLIDQAQRQQSQQQQSSQQQSQDQQSQQSQQQAQQGSQQQQGQQQAQGTGQGGNVPRQDGQTRQPPAGASAAWGNLPAHVRDALMQGFSDRFSSTYQRLTEQYYQRLAEQQRPGAAPSSPHGGGGAP